MNVNIEMLKSFLKLGKPIINDAFFSEKFRRSILNNVIETALYDSSPASTEYINGIQCLKLAQNKDQEKIILYFHGGGYHWGSALTHKNLVVQLCNDTGYNAILPEYSLAPEKPFPNALNDVTDVYKALLANNKPGNIIIAGDSAGGGLALACLLKLKSEGVELPKKCLLISPWVDLTLSGESMITKKDADPMLSPFATNRWEVSYAGSEDLKNPLVSPLFGDLSALPEILIHVGEDEILLDDSTRLHEKLKEAGGKSTIKVWPKMFHDFHMFHLLLADARKALKEASSFIRQ